MLRNLSHLVKVIQLDGKISRTIPLMNGVNSSSILSCHSYFYPLSIIGAGSNVLEEHGRGAIRIILTSLPGIQALQVRRAAAFF